jgi:para-aminobenzoate synthetase component 1
VNGTRALPFFDDPGELSARLAPLGNPTLLDSGGGDSGHDIIAAAPARELQLPSSATARELVDFTAELHELERTVTATGGPDRGAPFNGGLLGFFSYELGRRLMGLAPRHGSQPLAVVRYYPWAIVQDRAARRARLCSSRESGLSAALLRSLPELLAAPAPPAPPLELLTPFAAAWDEGAYRSRFDRVMDYIRAGDCYQANLGQPYRATYRGSLLQCFRELRQLARAPYSACFPLVGEALLLCLSPEQFLSVRQGLVETQPIKGTRPRATDSRQDRALAQELLASEKERAENLMIVDLLRNDIGRFCSAGSVRVEELFALKSYATVHHLVSRVSGRLRPGVTALELLLGCLPGGSITGCPKRRAMEVIDELEAAPRESWCGTLFSLSHGGQLNSNILIRTLHGDGSQLTCWAGGGLVADSDPAAEYRELEHKVGAFLAALDATA